MLPPKGARVSAMIDSSSFSCFVTFDPACRGFLFFEEIFAHKKGKLCQRRASELRAVRWMDVISSMYFVFGLLGARLSSGKPWQVSSTKTKKN